MTEIPTPDQIKLWHQWAKAANETAVDTAVRQLYVQIDEQIAAYQPVCQSSGRCCDFNAFGHRLYVCGLEIAWFLEQQTEALPTIDLLEACPWQIDKRCTAHCMRPLGCRIFYCQLGGEDWQQALYEQFQTQIKQLHETHAIPYRYMEWRAGLAEAITASETS